MEGENEEEAKEEPTEKVKESTEEANEESKEENTEEKEPKAATGQERFFLKPCAPEACDSIFVNGENLPEEGVELTHNDRVIFGNNTVFCFKFLTKHKQELTAQIKEETPEISEEDLATKLDESISHEKEIDWEYAQNEKMEKADKVRKEEQEREEKQKMEEHQKKIDEEKKMIEEQMQQKQKEYEDRMKDLGKS